jgi:adenylate cyclase class 2
MAVEIELKARIDNIKPLREKLSQKGVFLREFDKHDTYWANEKAFRIRIRRDNGKTFVTYKQKEILGKIEVNQEKEFEVSDAGEFERILDILGMIRDFKKEKRGWAWEISSDTDLPVLAELSDVRGLGWFLELEILAPNDDPVIVEKSRKRLFALLDDLGIPPGMVESRPYMALLKQLFPELG